MDNKKLVDVILWLARSEAVWREMPECFVSWNNGFQLTVERRYLRAYVSGAFRRSRF